MPASTGWPSPSPRSTCCASSPPMWWASTTTASSAPTAAPRRELNRRGRRGRGGLTERDENEHRGTEEGEVYRGTGEGGAVCAAIGQRASRQRSRPPTKRPSFPGRGGGPESPRVRGSAPVTDGRSRRGARRRAADNARRSPPVARRSAPYQIAAG